MPNVTVNGRDIFYYDDDFTHPWQPTEVVLINHYGTGDSTLYNRWVPGLAGDYRVIRWDRPGHGRSEKPGFDYKLTVESFMADMIGFLDALGLEKVHYVGDKVSSAAGIVLANMQPQRLRSLTLTSCFLSVSRLRQHFYDAADEVIRNGSWVNAYKKRSAEDNASHSSTDPLQALYFSEVQARIPAHVIAAAYRCCADPAFDVEPLLSKIKTPTLLLSPDNAAPLVTMEEQAHIAKTIPNCEQRVFKGANADLPYVYGEWCAEQALPFFKEHGG
jgi:pimeloyl-ACP methyl ester carboxylesterase